MLKTYLNKIFLAPMAGVTDTAFRHICVEQGCGLTYCEMVSSNALSYGSKKTVDMMLKAENEEEFAIQIFGGDSDMMADTAKMVYDLLGESLSLIDINMGCPAPKITKNGYGSALMADPKKASDIIRKVKASVPIPVTVKFRKGIDDEHINGIEFAKMAQDSGADAIAVHGRTAKQLYTGTCDWEYIRLVKQSVDIPVIASGDVKTPMDAIAIKKATGCEYMMIGRGAMGNPWIFKNALLALDGKDYKEPTPQEKIHMARHHLDLLLTYKTHKLAIFQMRKHIGWYLAGIKDSSRVRNLINTLDTKEDMDNALLEFEKNL